MTTSDLNPRIVARGQQFFASIKGEKPGLFNKSNWTGKVMDWSMQNEAFKVQLFRFVDVLPYLNTTDSLQRHIEEYFAGDDCDIPAVLKWGAGKVGMLGSLGTRMFGKAIRSNIESMAGQFIIGENAAEAVKNIGRLRKDGFAVVVDLLGEATLSEAEADQLTDSYLDLLAAIGRDRQSWKPLGGGAGGADWGHAPQINVAIKPSAFYSQAKPVDVAGSVEAIYHRVAKVYAKVKELGGFMCIDMEQLKYREITLELYKRLRSAPEFRDYPHLGLVLQAYLKCTEADCAGMLAWAEKEKLPISIRLVKGAYWDYETVLAKQHGFDVPVWTIKAETDANYERVARMILEHSAICHFACASHNIRTISTVMETAQALGVPEDRYEFQVLYGMAEPVRKGLLKVAHRVRLYCPYGDLLPGMSYLVRRLLENTANESFLKQSFAEDADIDRLLEDPALTARKERDALEPPAPPAPGPGGFAPFANEPPADFTIPEVRAAFAAALSQVKGQLGKDYPLFIGGQELHTDTKVESYNPAEPGQIIGRVSQADTRHVDQAMAEAKRAFPSWRDRPAVERARFLIAAAQAARQRIFELSAWQILEVGKQWDQAYNDVGEAIDFLEYYAREMMRLDAPQRMGNAPGEVNTLFYQPCGVAAVIAPWNFPLAISCGMVAAALVAGNTVLYKPANLSPVVGWTLCQILREAGLPSGVFNYVPGNGRQMGDYLVEHPDTAIIAFTGSMEVGLGILEKAAVVRPGQENCKKVVCEMGGKNAIIIDDDADLDEAVGQVIYSAFGFQGQKCSACSRVVVLAPIYDKFVGRLTEAVKALKIGPGEDPANYMGPVVDKKAQEKILEYVAIGAQEGQVLYQSPVPAQGCYVPLTVIAGIEPRHRLAQEEIFGPVLSVMQAADFDEALAIANGTRFALTGAVFSRSPKNLERARQEFRVGNLYLNRGSTGALVYRQPFGGFKMSGVGSKAGGPDYLIRFMDPRCVTENTMRRGFTPIEETDDWVA